MVSEVPRVALDSRRQSKAANCRFLREPAAKWEDEDDRPIFFLELRGEYLCSWCEMVDGYLNAVPHPKSKCQVRRFAYPREADIVGRVIGVTMRLVEAE